MQITNCIYLMKQLRASPLTLYHTSLSFVMIAIPHRAIEVQGEMLSSAK